MTSWVAEARFELLNLSLSGGGFGYRAGVPPAVEPTVLACLGLLATGGQAEDHEVRLAVRKAANWLVTIQQAGGSVGVSAEIPAPGWGTPYALLLWATDVIYARPREKAIDWLLGQKGVVYPQVFKDICEHDPSIEGWPWVDGTYSWIEPTALAILALRRGQKTGNLRVREGLRLIKDRAIRTGGWNCGKGASFGADARPLPGPTGLALLALAGAVQADKVVADACEYLEQTLPLTRAAQSLSWGLLGLAAWGKTSPDSSRWLAESYERNNRPSDNALQLAYLLLAAGQNSLALLGVCDSGGGRDCG